MGGRRRLSDLCSVGADRGAQLTSSVAERSSEAGHGGDRSAGDEAAVESEEVRGNKEGTMLFRE